MSATRDPASIVDPPACYACSVRRSLRDVSPIAPDYEIRSFECPKCGTLLRLVAKCETCSSDAAG